jgi:tRNA pseudouridine55 synthase
LTRSRQGRFVLHPTEEGELGCVPWEVFQKAFVDSGEADHDGWTEWEREVIERLEVVEPKK